MSNTFYVELLNFYCFITEDHKHALLNNMHYLYTGLEIRLVWGAGLQDVSLGWETRFWEVSAAEMTVIVGATRKSLH